MFTLTEIKTRVYKALEQYTANGAAIAGIDTRKADIEARMCDAIDSVQRKIMSASRKRRVTVPVTLAIPEVLGEALGTYAVPHGGCLYVGVPDGTKSFTFSANRPDVAVEIYCCSGAEAPAEPAAVIGNADLIPEGTADCTVTRKGSGYVCSGFPGSPSFIDGVPVLRISVPAGEASVSRLAFYRDSFPSPREIPEPGTSYASLPGDVMRLEQITDCSGRRPAESGFIFDTGYNFMTAPDGTSGTYSITYIKYPARISASTPGDTPMELDDFACDALVYGAAAAVCPADDTSAAAKLNAYFDDCMRNIHNTEHNRTGVVNSVFLTSRRGLSGIR